MNTRSFTIVQNQAPQGPQNDEFAMANEFYRNGLEAYDQFMVGEEPAKVMYLALLAMGGKDGMAGLAIGPPGGGKSLLLENGHRVIRDYTSENIATVPHQADLQATDLLGKSSEINRSVSDGSTTTNETLTQASKAILHPGVRVVKFDEINRTSQLALTAANGILQHGGMHVYEDGKPAGFNEFDLVVSAMNNFGTRYTFQLDPSLVSRHAMGVFTGSRETGTVTEASEEIWGSGTPRKNQGKIEIDPSLTITRDELLVVRGAIDKMFIHPSEGQHGKRLTATMLDTLRNELPENQRLEFSDVRVSKQVSRIARTLALLRGERNVENADINQAMAYNLTAKLGASTQMPESEVDQMASQIIEKAS